MMSAEQWRDITDYEGLYQVSNLGRVRSLTRTITYKDGRRSYTLQGRVLKPGLCKGYPYVNLCKSGTRRQYRIHTLVLLHFVGHPPTSTHECNHKDGDRANNDVSNLEWVNRSENLAHKVNVLRTGAPPLLYGESNPRTVLTRSQVMALRRQYAEGNISQADLSEQYRITQTTVHNIVTGRTWRNAPGPITHRGKGYAAGGYNKRE